MGSVTRRLLLASAMAFGLPWSASATTYALSTTIPIPGSTLGSFDISYVDSVTGIYYLADRTDASVDIINGANNQFLGKAGGFVGAVTIPPSTTVSTARSGPDGVVVVNNGTTATLYAGDGGSTLRSFNVTNPSNPIAGGTVYTGGAPFRVDEMAYSPLNQQLFVANNANSPAFGSLISTSTALAPALTTSPVLVPAQIPAGGLEQPVWDPATKTYFVSVPNFANNDAGGVQEFDSAGKALRTYNFSNMGIAACGSAGLALGASGNLVVGCSATGSQTIVLNPSGTGSIVANLKAVSGSDELWYDEANGNYYVTGVNAAGDRVIDVFSDASYALLQSIDLTSLGAGKSNLHSVAVDVLNGNIFVPLTGTSDDTLCPGGCVAVFAEVPEPASLPVLVVALTGLAGLAGWRRFGREG